jgi:hypothetical protein
VLPPVTGLLFVLGSLWWGRQVVEAHKAALTAKDEQIRVKEAEIGLLERITPTHLVAEMQALNASNELLLARAREDARRQMDEVQQATGKERMIAEATQSAYQERLRVLEARLAISDAALTEAMAIAAKWQGVQTSLAQQARYSNADLVQIWEATRESLSPATRKYFENPRLTSTRNRVVVTFPDRFKHDVTDEMTREIFLALRDWFTDGTELVIMASPSAKSTDAGGLPVTYRYGRGVRTVPPDTGQEYQ